MSKSSADLEHKKGWFFPNFLDQRSAYAYMEPFSARDIKRFSFSAFLTDGTGQFGYSSLERRQRGAGAARVYLRSNILPKRVSFCRYSRRDDRPQ